MNSGYKHGFSFRIALAIAALAMLTLTPMSYGQPTAPAPAAQPGGAASRYLRTKHEEVLRLLRRPATTPADQTRRSEEVSRILSSLLDYQELSRRALGTHWAARTDAEKTQFVTLLRRLVERNYQQNLTRIVDFEISYGRETTNSDGALVVTSARSRTERRQPPVEISYSMRLENNQWRAFDVSTDGVSMVRNYQTQFNRIIVQNSWAELIRRMEQRLAAGQS